MRHRLLKSLRIAVTAVSLLVCGLLIVLWVRSHFVPEGFFFDYNSDFRISVFSVQGSVEVVIERPWEGLRFVEIAPDASILWKWVFLGAGDVESFHQSKRWEFQSYDRYSKYWKKYWWYRVLAPYWFHLTIFATIAALPWIKWRFSLRTLLIVLTLFALFFGAIAMSM